MIRLSRFAGCEVVISSLASKVTTTHQRSSRNGADVDHFVVHHAASTSHQGVVNMMTSGSREVSAHYVVSEIIESVVDEDYRAWSLGSASWDARSVTVETINNSTEGWTVSDTTFDNLARLIADWSVRYGIPITDDTVLTHQEVYRRYGASYPTACPGDLQRRKPELLKLAQHYASTPTPQDQEDEDEDMSRPTTIAKVTKGNEVEVTTFWPDGSEHVYGSTNTAEGQSYNRNVALAYGCAPQMPIIYITASHYDKVKAENKARRER